MGLYDKKLELKDEVAINKINAIVTMKSGHQEYSCKYLNQ